MTQFHIFRSTFILFAFFCMLHPSVHAQEIYKWTDANGKVHYGDRAAAPDSSKKIKVIATPPSQPQAVTTAPAAGSQRRPPQMPNFDFPEKSTPVNPALVGSTCKSLIDQIGAVPAGKNWESLYKQFNSACPGIAYHCWEYQSTPQKNQCTWVERSGSSVLHRKKYP